MQCGLYTRLIAPMIRADLYLNRIDFLRYLPGSDCRECGVSSCAAFLQQFKEGNRGAADCPSLPRHREAALRLALSAHEILPAVPALDLPRPGFQGLMEINNPEDNSPILVSGNNQFTQEVVTTLMAATVSPFRLLFVDCRGDTVDMAMIYDSLTAEGIRRSLGEAALLGRRQGLELILPGFASRLREPLERETGCRVRVGPLCIAELPLFLGERWHMADDFGH
jgi:CO dehydrogenase/acetyl-CoA synthase gamma subunit (corrinoid Fe-S protein)